jgi:hypothetical protein
MAFKCPKCQSRMQVVQTRSHPDKTCRILVCGDGCGVLRTSTEMIDTDLARLIATTVAKLAPPENRAAAYDAAMVAAGAINPDGRDTDIRHAAMQVLHPPTIEP